MAFVAATRLGPYEILSLLGAGAWGNSKHWAATVKELDEVMTEWEKAVETADDEKLAKWLPRSPTLERITPTISAR